MPFDEPASEIQWHSRPTDFDPLTPFQIATGTPFAGAPARQALLAFPVRILRSVDSAPKPWTALTNLISWHPDLHRLRAPEAEPHRMFLAAAASIRPAIARLSGIAIGADTWEGRPDISKALDIARVRWADAALAEVDFHDRAGLLAAFEDLAGNARARVRKRGPQGATSVPDAAARLAGDLLPARVLIENWAVFRPEPRIPPFCLQPARDIAEMIGKLIQQPVRANYVSLAINLLSLKSALTEAERKTSSDRLNPNEA